MSTTPLAGRPPFAIDDDNVKYANPESQPRRQVQKPDNPNNRTSAYNTYDNYLPGDEKSVRSSRMSGHGAIGGLMGGSLSDDESDDEGPGKAPAKSKNQALFEAAVTKPNGKTLDGGPSSSSATGASSEANPPPAYQHTNSAAAMNAKQGMEKRPPGAGLPVTQPLNPKGAAPHTAIHPSAQQAGGPPFARSGTASPTPPAAPLHINIPHAAPQPQRLQPAFMGQGPPPHSGQGAPNLQPFHYQGAPGNYSIPSSPGSFPPTPIQPAFIGPSSTPIQPAFIKWGPDPEKSPSLSRGPSSAMSHESSMPILRGNAEETLLAKSSRAPGVGPRPGAGRRTDGDDFWRRFSMVVKKEKGSPAEKTSPWLKKNMQRGTGFSRWVWVIGIMFLLIIVGGAVTIWWFTRGSPDHQVPIAIGGGASQTMTNTVTSKAPVAEPPSPKGPAHDRPLITGTATFGTKPIVDKRALPTYAFADQAWKMGRSPSDELHMEVASPTITPSPHGRVAMKSRLRH